MAEKKKKEKRVDVPNQGHKHIFGTTEKSDFILNMTGDGAQKLCTNYSIFTILLLTLLAIPAYFTTNVGEYELYGQVHYLSENFIFYVGAFLMLMGFIGFLIFTITVKKGQISLKKSGYLLLPAVISLLAAVSCFSSEDIHSGLLGHLGRHEGLLTVMAYFGMMTVAIGIHKEELAKRLIDIIVATGTFHAVVSVLQAAGIITNFFERLFVRSGSAGADSSAGEYYYEGGATKLNGIYINGRAGSGFATSPHALAAILTVAFACAMAGAAFGKVRLRRALYSGAAVMITAGAFFAKVLPARVGIITAGAVILVIAVIKLIADEKDGKSAAVVFVPAVLSAAAAIVIVLSGKAPLRDKNVIVTDGYVMRWTISNISTDAEHALDPYSYSELVNSGEIAISDAPMLGIGPDNGVDAAASGEHGLWTDRLYNEYVDLAVTRGVPALIFQCIFLVLSAVTIVKGVIRYLKGEGSWISAACAGAVFAYLVQAWFNTTWVNSTYFFYLMLGLAWGLDAFAKDEEKTKGKKERKIRK